MADEKKNKNRPTKFKCYRALMEKLRASSVSNPGKTGKYLLEVFVENDGRIRASEVVARGLCIEGQFTEWRRALQIKELIIFHKENERWQYRPGKQLVKYVNQEKLRFEIATKEELDKRTQATYDHVGMVDAKVEGSVKRIKSLESKVSELSTRLDEFAEMVITLKDPECTVSKKERFLDPDDSYSRDLLIN